MSSVLVQRPGSRGCCKELNSVFQNLMGQAGQRARVWERLISTGSGRRVPEGGVGWVGE